MIQENKYTSRDAELFPLIGRAVMSRAAALDAAPHHDRIPAELVARFQGLHFFLVNVLAAVGAAACVVLAFVYPITWLEPCILLGMWIVTGGLGISVGHHRLFTHRAFRTYAPIRALLAICGSMAGQGPVIYWACLHRAHHQHSDAEHDLHSPRPSDRTWRGYLASFWHAHTGWVMRHDVPLASRYAPDLLDDQIAVWVNRFYLVWLALGMLIPAMIGGLVYQSWHGALVGLLWGGSLRLFLGNHLTWSVNSICHMLGYQTYPTSDESRNNLWIAAPTFGEGWHNNHHAFAASARFGIKWWELAVDSGYHFIRLLELCGLAWDVKRPGVRH